MNGEGIGIADFSEGVDTSGVSTYLAEIKSDSLDKAAEAVKNTEVLKTACDDNWSGKACEDFKAKLDAAATHLAAQYDQLYKNLENQINQVALDMKTFDEGLL